MCVCVCLQLQVYRNGQHVRKYEDDSAENEGRAASLPNQPLRVRLNVWEGNEWELTCSIGRSSVSVVSKERRRG